MSRGLMPNQETKLYPGTKCWGIPNFSGFKPEILGDIYRSIADEYGAVQVKRPRPGDHYRKMPKSLNEMDRPAFKKLPNDIEITQPPRLFRSTGWKYHGMVHLDCELYWEFEAKYKFGDKYIFDWYPVRILSYAYIYNTITFPKPQQLSLF